MEKSIETIWKEGFLKDEVLLAPKINNLYNQKSKHYTERFKRDFKINLIAIAGVAIIVLISCILIGIPFVGIGLFLLFASLVIVGKKELATFKKIDSGLTSYEYIKSFDFWLKNVIILYTKVYRIFYPLFFLTIVLGVWFSDIGQKIMDKLLIKFPSIYLVNEIPVFWLMGTILFTGLLAYFGGEIYKLDIKIAYGRQLKKLEEMLEDMEELKG